MKKVIFSALVLSGGLFACSKADIQNNSNLSSNDVVTTPTKTGDMKRTWHDDGSRPWVMGQTRGCVGMGGICAQATPVPTKDMQMFGDIENGASVIEFFVNSQVSMLQYFSLETMEAVIIGEMSVEVLGGLDTEMYFVFSEGTTVREVIPFTK